ncbi:MAG: hypothetical protein HOW73_43355 [Polyangiaceae bacterium]|nr:hypothetical protein [Polyangiaceae bacterium]
MINVTLRRETRLPKGTIAESYIEAEMGQPEETRARVTLTLVAVGERDAIALIEGFRGLRETDLRGCAELLLRLADEIGDGG